MSDRAIDSPSPPDEKDQAKKSRKTSKAACESEPMGLVRHPFAYWDWRNDGTDHGGVGVRLYPHMESPAESYTPWKCAAPLRASLFIAGVKGIVGKRAARCDLSRGTEIGGNWPRTVIFLWKSMVLGTEGGMGYLFAMSEKCSVTRAYAPPNLT